MSRFTPFVPLVLLAACSWLYGMDLRVVTPSQDEFLKLLAVSARDAGFKPEGSGCGSSREDRDVAYCAEYQSKKNVAPLRLVARARNGVQLISAIRLNDGLASDEKEALIALVTSLRDGGAKLCFDQQVPGSGLPRSLKAWLKGNCP